MIKRIVATFLGSYAESLKLQEHDHVLVTRLGWLTVEISCLALLFVMYYIWLMFGLPLEGGNIDGLRLKLILWIIVIAVIVPILFFAGMVMLNGLFGLALYALGKLTWTQFIDFSWRAKYPANWYKPSLT